jgi:hypothetical protein
MSNFYTLSYSNAVQGWASFYTYNPDWMIGMNQFFYTFKGGNLFWHNKNALRNTFYGAFQPTKIKSVFNDMPLDNKVFKTLILEGQDSWSATLETDIEDNGFITDSFFEKKEGTYFAFVRNSGLIPAETTEYPLRSVNGIGRSSSIGGTLTNPIINFPLNVNIGSIISVGDIMYFAPPPYTTPLVGGTITNIEVDLPNSINRITLAVLPSSTSPILPIDAYFMFIKNSVAESHGVLGHYCVFELTNSLTTATELFVVGSEVSKSYP